MSQLVGYARTSTAAQSPASQLDALKTARCVWVFTETASGAQGSRLELHQALEIMCKGDLLVVWRLDCLAHSVHQLVDIAADLYTRRIKLRLLQDAIDRQGASKGCAWHTEPHAVLAHEGWLGERSPEMMISLRLACLSVLMTGKVTTWQHTHGTPVSLSHLIAL